MYPKALAMVFGLVACGLSSEMVAAQPGPKAEGPGLVTKVYSLQTILGPKGKASGVRNPDDVVKLILETVSAEFKPGLAGQQLIVRDGGKLEVRAAAKTQAEVGDLLAALASLADIAVEVKSELIELTPAQFASLQKTLPTTARPLAGSPILFSTPTNIEERKPTAEEEKAFAEMNKILKAGQVVQTSSGRYLNGSESNLSAREFVVAYDQNQVNKKPVEPPHFVKEGYKLIGLPIVSADRRFIRLKLTEQGAVLNGIKKQDFGEIIDGQRLVITAPETTDLGSTGSVSVPDGGLLVFKLGYAPKDRVWLVVLHPTIFIQAEQDELKKGEKKK
jgi:hypothetical protein